MISTLHIRNIGIIDDLSVEFNEGFNVLTGETGSGKTLIVGSLAIIAGGRFSKEMIRKGETYCFVEASIFCPESEYAVDGNIIVSREIYLNGRNSCKINGRLVTVSDLKEIMSNIIDIHGQQDSRNLLDAGKHIDYLDAFIGEELEDLKEKYKGYYTEYNNLKLKLSQNYGDDKERERKLDLLEYQLNEIDNTKLKIGEDDELQEKHNIMKNQEKLQENLSVIDEVLSVQVIEGVSTSIKCLEKIEGYSEIYSKKLSELKNIYYEIQELSRDISGLKDDIYFDAYDRDNIERRLDDIFSLKRKYGNTIEEILKYKEELEKEINIFKNKEEINQNLKEQKSEIEKQMKHLCDKMSFIRKNYAKQLSEKINDELKDLEMVNSKFDVQVVKLDDNNFGINGLDKVEFMICTNTGEEKKELIKIASGGEMSRVMLAIKNVLSEVDKVPILIFDEIDTGISGKAAKSVGDKIKFISKSHQIICITHLPTIAAKGDYNYYISKSVKNNKTQANVRKLNEEETISEIARIANGEITKAALENAKELRKAG